MGIRIAQLTLAQQRGLALADEQGRAFVTLIDGRVAIILPPQPSDKAIAAYIAAVARALEALAPGSGGDDQL